MKAPNIPPRTDQTPNSDMKERERDDQIHVPHPWTMATSSVSSNRIYFFSEIKV